MLGRGTLAPLTIPEPTATAMTEKDYKVYMCIICGWMYDEKTGSPEDGIAPGTRWEDVPEDWCCPDCGASKDDFEMVES